MASKSNPLNLIKVSDPHSLKLPKTLAGGLAAFGLFLTGYSAAPSHYAVATKQYVEGFVDTLRSQGKAAVPITSPTTSPDSVDAISTVVAHTKHTDILYVTAKDYTPYIDPSELPASVDKKRFAATPKYYFDDKADYSLASALASDVTEVTGGRDVAVSDFMNAVNEAKTVILVRNSKLPSGFDFEKNRPLNAEEYLERMITADLQGQKMPYPAVNGFDAAYMQTHHAALKKVKLDDVDHPTYLLSPSLENVVTIEGEAPKAIRSPVSATRVRPRRKASSFDV